MVKKNTILILTIFLGVCPLYSQDVIINFAGDVRLDGYIAEKAEQNGYDYPFSRISDLFKDSHVNCVNLETAVSKRGEAIEKTYRFKADPQMLEVLVKSNINIVNIANNHTGDFGHEAFNDTLENLKKNNIKYFGGGPSLYESRNSEIVTVGDVKVAFLGFSNTLPAEQWAKKEKPGITPAFLEYIKQDVRKAKSKADYVFVVYHGGDERSYYPKQVQKDIAHTAIDNGADAVVGHHPHVLQGIEVYNGKLIFYSLGNFLFLSKSKKCYDTGVLRVIINKSGFEYVFYPIVIGDAFLRRPDDKEKLRIFDLLKDISGDFGANLELSQDSINIKM
ncbi:MAG: CapA family protein [bacterium]